MKCSRFKIALLTFLLGIISVQFFNQIYQKWSEPFVQLPQVKSNLTFFVITKTKDELLKSQWSCVASDKEECFTRSFASYPRENTKRKAKRK